MVCNRMGFDCSAIRMNPKVIKKIVQMRDGYLRIEGDHWEYVVTPEFAYLYSSV